MKKIHIALLVLIAVAIGVLISFLKTTATYETIAQAMGAPGKFVHIAVKLDRSVPVQYDAVKDPNFLSFNATDSSGKSMKVVYRKGERQDILNAMQLVLQGKYVTDHFECEDIQTKCPSKYKDDIGESEKNLQQNTQSPSQNNSPSNKY